MSSVLPATDLQPIKASLVADLVDLINLNIGVILKPGLAACVTCRGHGQVGADSEAVTCGVCGGVGAVECYDFDIELLKTPQVGRWVEQYKRDKNGNITPVFRSKTQAFAQLTKILGFDKAVLEIANSASFADSISEEQRAVYLEQVRELAAAGKL